MLSPRIRGCLNLILQQLRTTAVGLVWCANKKAAQGMSGFA